MTQGGAAHAERDPRSCSLTATTRLNRRLRTCADRQEWPPVRAAALQLKALVCKELLKVGVNRADARLHPRIWAGSVPNGHLGAHCLDIETLRAQKPNETNRAQIRQAASAEPAPDPFKGSSANQGLGRSAAAYPRKS
jgi:hypothetical protein